MKEIWKPIVGYEGLYEVSDQGRVRSLDRVVLTRRSGTEFLSKKKGKILSTRVSRGYLQAFISLKGKYYRKNVSVHRLVAEAFIPNPNNYPQINHKDENKLNNAAENLEWCTAKYNANYGTRIARTVRVGAENKRSKPIIQMTLNGEFVKRYVNTNELRKEGKYAYKSVWECITGRSNQAYGYLWRFAEKKEGVHE